jgi:uncharacterized protein (DUF1015 family)
MPKIKPFKGIRPSQSSVEKVVVNLENLSISEAKLIRQENPYSYVNMLVPKLDNIFLMGSKNELAFKKINENFEDFLDKGIFIQDEKPSIYIYQVRREGITQTGIWTVTSIDDYLNNVVKKHELTNSAREQSLIDYIQQTGIDANPVLITYSGVPAINYIIKAKIKHQADIAFQKDQIDHFLWKIDDDKSLKILIDEFAKLSSTYIADGHHRAAATSLLGIQRRKLNLKHKGDEEYNFFTSIYMSTDQLKIYGFNRLIKGLSGLSPEEIIVLISKKFNVIESDIEVEPHKMSTFGMYLASKWYHLSVKTEIVESDNPLNKLDVSILQDHIISPIFKISNPRTDTRISYIGGKVPINKIALEVDNGTYSVAFILYPTAIDQLMDVADAGEIMPPKSTWFEPKFDVGLLIHHIN